jgi:nucleoid-associated protein EbfC
MATRNLRRKPVFGKGLGGLGDMAGLLKNAMQMKDRIEEVKESLANERVEAQAGGGMVTVVMNGKFEVQSVRIEPEIIDPNEKEMLETLVAAATNEATRRVQELVKSKMTEITGGVNIPGLTT